MERYVEALGPARVFAAAQRLDAGANPSGPGSGLDDYLTARVRAAHTPAEREAVASEGYQLTRRFGVNGFSLGTGRIAVLAAQTDDAELREWAGKWFDAQKTRVSPDKKVWYDLVRSEQVVLVGAALKRDDAEKYRDIWLQQIDKPHSQNLRQYLPDWGETLWQVDPRWFDEIVGQWPAPQQVAAMSGALKVENDPTQARALLTRLEKLVDDPAVIADAQKPEHGIAVNVEALSEGRTNFARSMALVDAPAALDALDKVRAVIDSGEIYEIAAIIARAAIADGRKDIARRALQLGLRDGYSSGAGAPMLALVARGFDADLSAQLLEVARKNATASFSFGDPAGTSDVAAYAIALRDVDAGAGRLVLEDQWAKRQQTPEKPNLSDEDYPKRQRVIAQEKLAWGMAFYDLPRALQWLGEVKDDRDEWNNGLERTRLSIFVAALTPPERRYLLLRASYFQ